MPQGVTTLEEECFNNCTSLASVVLPDNLTAIKERCFLSCTALSSVALPENLTEIGRYAFAHCTGLAAIYACMPTPLVLTSDVFEDVDKEKCTLYVTQDAYQTYWLADVWGDFLHVTPFDPTGIGTTAGHGTTAETERYAINGTRTTTPTKGLNIVKYSDGTVKKVMVK